MSMQTWIQLLRSRRGNAYVTALIAAGIIIGVGVVMMNRATASTRQMQQSAEADQAWYLAMSGIHDVMSRLHWDGTSWKNKKAVNVTANVGGGSYQAQTGAYQTTVVTITSTGKYGDFTRTLVGVAQWVDPDTTPGQTSLYGGGNWRFSGTARIEGNIASMGSIVFAGDSELCGVAYAEGSITLEPPKTHMVASCHSFIKPNYTILQEYNDDVNYNATPDKSITGDYTLTETDTTATWTHLRATGVVTIKKDLKFLNRNVYIIAEKGFRISNSVSADQGHFVFLYSKANYGGADPCVDMKTVQESDVGSTLTAWVDGGEHHDVVLWIPNGGIYFKGNQAGGQTAGVYGKVYGKCVQTQDNWNYFPGADVPDGGNAQGSNLTLNVLYEQ